ncbi:hypothetical protein FocTR4_00012329 [Fusarium oxysporum f. sp. cubense]|uniref:Kinesin light chain n=2 Tax=Fusarium oxysporum species complex TaxID=171631 RepID=A0A5C6SK31_FUSOC|nr:hypothetical protein FocTR4_00012329 [Fusarium oxysporum f. sp. cubense]
MADIASWCKDTGRYKEAEELQDSAINSLEGIVGEDHPNTLYFKVDLIGIYTRQG